MQRTLLFIILSVFVILGACSRSGESTTGEGAASSSGSEKAEGTEGQLITVIEPGAEPRRALRYTFEPGLKERVDLDLDVAVAAALGDEATPELRSPPIRLGVEAGPAVKVADDRLRYALAITDAKLAVQMEDQEKQAEIEAVISPLRQIRGWVEVDSRGITHDFDFDVPDAVPPRTRTMLDNIRTSLMSVPFPTEPIGVGARWQVKRRVDLETVEVEQTLTYSLRDLRPDGGRLTVTVHQSAPPQPMRGTMQGGAHADVEAYEMSGLGSVEFQFNRLTPIAEADTTTQMRAKLQSGAESRLFQLRMRTAVDVIPTQELVPPPAQQPEEKLTEADPKQAQQK